jgi:hypothetical protein
LLNVTFTDATHFVVTYDGQTSYYTTASVNDIAFTGTTGPETVIFSDPNNAYTAAETLGAVHMTTSGFTFDANGVTDLYVYANSQSTATVNVPSGPNFFVGVANPNYSYVYGGGIFSEAAGFGSVSATGQGSSTYAYLYSASHASVVADPTTGSKLTAGSLSVDATGFPQVYAVGASDGTDSITLDSDGTKFVGSPLFSYVTDSQGNSPGTFIIGALYFASVKAQASSSVTDTAYFYSYGQDAFSGTPTLSELSGSNSMFSNFAVQAAGYNSVTVWASGSGADSASLTSPGNGTFVSTASYDTLTVGASSIQVIGYSSVLATGAHNYTDVAYVYDTSGNNTLSTQGTSAILTTSSYTVTVDRFGKVIATQQSGDDTVHSVSAIDYALQTIGNWTNS